LFINRIESFYNDRILTIKHKNQSMIKNNY